MNSDFYEDEFLCYKTVIVANGEPPKHEACLKLLQQAERIICCDGAIEHLEALGFVPDLIIGDGDSITPEQRLKYSTIFLENRDDTYCDLHKSIRYCKEHYYGEAVAIVGASGLREDHELANISLLLTYGAEIPLLMATNFGIFTPLFGTSALSSYPGQQISIFTFADTPVTFHQLKYPVKEKQFDYFWEGSLNEALENCFKIEFPQGKVLVFRAY